MNISEQVVSKVIQLEGAVNFRDMGGMKAADGRVIKEGILFRSADLFELTNNDVQLIETLGLKTIFDYRTTYEANKRPDPQLKNISFERMSVNNESRPQSYTSIREWLASDPFKDFDTSFLTELYKSIPVGNRSYQRLMEMLKQPELHLPLLHHCTGGRDRTGVGSMLILLTLGVSWEIIVEDYLYSNQLLEESNNHLLAEVDTFLTTEEIERFKQGFQLQERYLQLSYQNILDHYKSFDDYLEHEHGITHQIRNNIRNFCLE
ncbi:tyrosine-protein phosphatase [Gracilibacillus sp. HCP3S3_G5_1]|uniref:tyrosine-protein phosphatase n=1 Tax=unclassified Gracilibacillus TaxID=2625209 RepID=UPI003F8A0069